MRKDEQMGYKIKEIRNEKRMTQMELAEKSGVSRTIIAQLESGKRTQTTTKTLIKLASALGTTVDNIFFNSCV